MVSSSAASAGSRLSTPIFEAVELCLHFCPRSVGIICFRTSLMVTHHLKVKKRITRALRDFSFCYSPNFPFMFGCVKVSYDIKDVSVLPSGDRALQAVSVSAAGITAVPTAGCFPRVPMAGVNLLPGHSS